MTTSPGITDQTNVKSMCRLCSGNCGMIVTIDEGRISQVRGDREHVFSRGYACPRGLDVPDAMNAGERIMTPLKRAPDGTFQPITLETALDEIAARVAAITSESGQHAIGMFKGTGGYVNACASQIWRDWMAAIGSPNYFTTNTIDQSSHSVTAGRMGYWDAGRVRLADCDVVLLVGTNPLVSLGAYSVLSADPAKRLKDARGRGTKFIVIDPRQTETAARADCFLQPLPGQDVSIISGIIRIILEHGWEDRAFCAEFVEGVDALRAAVSTFTPDYVAARAGIDAALLEQAAALFARDARRGHAAVGTGGTMAPRSNLTDHLVECLNAICGYYLRAGDKVPNAGVTVPLRPFRAQVVPANRSWETSGKSGTGYGEMNGERMSGVLADEMLTDGPHRIRALFVNAGNPAVALPDQDKAVAGLRKLDLLVTVDPLMTATALLSDYIIPPKMFYERVDLVPGPDLDVFLNPFPFAQYIPAAVSPPPGSELTDEWSIFWELAKRLDLQLSFAGVPLDPSHTYTTDELLEILLRDARVPLAQIRAYPAGHVFDEEQFHVLPAATGAAHHRLQLAPPDVLDELAEVAREPAVQRPGAFPYLLSVRRIRTMTNSFGRDLPRTRSRSKHNPLFVHPEDLAALDLADGDRVVLHSSATSLRVAVAGDATMRRGVVSMSHCWGMLPNDSYDEVGVSTSRLVRTDVDVQAINAMPVMTAIPVNIIADPASQRRASRASEPNPDGSDHRRR